MRDGDGKSFQIVDGSYMGYGVLRGFFKTDEPTTGWGITKHWDDMGYFFDIAPDQLAEVSLKGIRRGLPPMEETEYRVPMRATVYNIEVADFHPTTWATWGSGAQQEWN